MSAWAHPTDEPLAYVFNGEPDGRALRRSTGEDVASAVVPEKGTPSLSIGRSTYELTTYGRGWRLAVVPKGRDEPVAWYTGGATTWGGGRIVVAPDREYRVKAAVTTPRWRIVEGRTELVRIDRKDGEMIARVLSSPEWSADAPLLVLMTCVIIELRQINQAHLPASNAG